MQNPRLLLVDSDAYTSSVLMDDLRQRGIPDTQHVGSVLELPKVLQIAKPDVVIFNYHSQYPESLIACSSIKLLSPNSAIIAIVSPGPALKAVRALAKEADCIDIIIEKPLSDERFYMAVEDLLKVKSATRELETRADKLSRLVPEGALTALESEFESDAEMFESAVLFTDIRGSSQLIREMPPREFFEMLNQLLSSQAKKIQQYEGSVIKYTGDGVMAVFKGMGRSYLALRCGLELAAESQNQRLACGIGITEGLVLAGLIGDSHQAGQRRQYDVIGANVHLAARLCSIANAGEVITTKRVNSVARLRNPEPRQIGSISIRGFEGDIDCVAFDLNK
jgi:class 3 adenylate cyclase